MVQPPKTDANLGFLAGRTTILLEVYAPSIQVPRAAKLSAGKNVFESIEP